MEKNRDYWNEGLPYLDGIEFYNFSGFSPELEAALLARRIDYRRLLDPVTLRKVHAAPGMSSTAFYQSAVHPVMVNNTKKPFDDPRVRRAFHLVLNRPALIEAVRDIAPMMVGGFVYPFSEFATPAAKLSERLGYQADPSAAIKAARQLMAAAGYANGIKGLDWLVRDGAATKIWAMAIQAMLKEALNVETTLRIVQITHWFDDAQAGRFDLASSPVVSTLMDPSDSFRCWYGKDGPQNYSKWSNTAFQELVGQIARELNETRRKALVAQAEGLMEQDPAVLPVLWNKINYRKYNYIKNYYTYNYFSILYLVLLNTFWLDM